MVDNSGNGEMTKHHQKLPRAEFDKIAEELGISIHELARQCGMTAAPSDPEIRTTVMLAARYVLTQAKSSARRHVAICVIPPHRLAWFKSTLEMARIETLYQEL